ncbi:MAG: hypothetical protein A3G33_08135 [Omnitrophica bacterium RIFCSPLOWO2_12_FULL_44_17]|uniref:Uncharacterized protein n=1 Tax=Candidatus Danuiimicrobium aquiferis TaxID=1801832 RepID=A0A1G1KXZ7_9BACT|nr:MAG: hypothetical protein A3B72_05835 [Omnitrophica bacterium RIFCSPHIGHO2_02_FULL_45_28]OGW89753.1 MAG: hypothetical protein A3E74_06300 [Omnitrophica bacterium RIFCSPHIGHO2_12_FULL_44_12]OGW97771.1 MAG: hypothetical protein A3G33_08135 [Omnitrophica bacterium RIFCSPLOWO2_12_FULL_44_17]OGX04977.1 MAG: hypothetical protein A3J12_02070 [Omnitrophica bacterium RIFCSPLOWO2_02_FULL_44_11]
MKGFRRIDMNRELSTKLKVFKQKHYRVIDQRAREDVNDAFVLRPSRDAAARIALEMYAERTSSRSIVKSIMMFPQQIRSEQCCATAKCVSVEDEGLPLPPEEWVMEKNNDLTPYIFAFTTFTGPPTAGWVCRSERSPLVSDLKRFLKGVGVGYEKKS